MHGFLSINYLNLNLKYTKNRTFWISVSDSQFPTLYACLYEVVLIV